MTTDIERIEHMLEFIQKIQDIVGKTSKDAFLASPMMQDAVLYNFAILGEAAGRLSSALRQENPDIPWGSMIGMRNVLIHDYVKTDFNFVWSAIVNDLPPLQKQLQKIKASV